MHIAPSVPQGETKREPGSGGHQSKKVGKGEKVVIANTHEFPSGFWAIIAGRYLVIDL